MSEPNLKLLADGLNKAREDGIQQGAKEMALMLWNLMAAIVSKDSNGAERFQEDQAPQLAKRAFDVWMKQRKIQ